jgi:putative aldouronate transport system permease protein
MSTGTTLVRPPAPPRRRPIWDEEPTLAGRALKVLALLVIVLAVGFPLYTVLLTSLSSQVSITRAGGLVVVPDGLTLSAYREVLSGGVVTRSLLVSTGVTLVGTLFSVTVTVLAAYGLSRSGSFAHRPLLLLILLTFLFTPGLIPTYLLVQSLGLIDQLAALILPSAISAFNLVVLRAFFMNAIPREVIDSAVIDGAGDLAILTRIVLPLSKAVTAVIALFYGVGYWDAFFNAFLYLNTNAKWPLQLVLRAYVLQGQPIPGVSAAASSARDALTGVVPTLAVKMAIIVLAVLPVLFVYPFVQRHFIKGVIVGAVKG